MRNLTRTAAATVAVCTALGLAAGSVGAQREPVRGKREVLREAAAYRESLQPDVFYVDRAGELRQGVRCATHGLTAAEHEATSQRVDALMRARGLELRAKNTVDVWIHVIHHKGEGKLASEDIAEQIRVLNRAFRKHRFKFKLQGVTYTSKKKWFRKCDKDSVYVKMTNALAVDPTKNLNIYTCNPSGGILGFAYLPGGAVTGTAQDGVVLLHSTFPNGTAIPYNEGDTGTHEVGHWAGLLHTFDPEPNGCREPGDRVDDTPYERTPDYSCTQERDTCEQEGADPITNFMDYVPDWCMVEFTKGQGQRMREQVAAFRPEA